MLLKELIYEREYICSDLPLDCEICNITSEVSLINGKTLFTLANSQKIPTFNTIPLGVICDSEAVLPDGIKAIRVNNARQATATLFYRFYGIDLKKIKMIAVTGTNGKTTTATFIKSILEESGKKVGFIGTGKVSIGNNILSNENYSMTTPDPELLYKMLSIMQKSGCEAIVMEASSHALALEKLFPLEFDYGIFTNLSSEHMDFHKNKEEYFAAKSRLFTMCKTAVLNIDDAYARRIDEKFNGKVIRTGVLWRGNVYATQIEDIDPIGTKYVYHAKDLVFIMKLNIPGVYNVYNSLLAAAVCIDMGIKPTLVREALSKITSVEGRFEIIKGRVTVIIDYAHTYSAFESFLKEVSRLKEKDGLLTVLFGCGGERDKSKRPKMAATAEKFADKVIITSDNSRGEDAMSIIADITDGFAGNGYKIIENRRDAIVYAIKTAKDGDTVVLVGKGPEKYNIDSEGYHHFDEREIVNLALKMKAEG